MRRRKLKFLANIYQLSEESKRIPLEGEYFLFELEDYPWRFEIKKAIKDNPFNKRDFYIYRKIGWGNYFLRKRGTQYEIYNIDDRDLYVCKCSTETRAFDMIDKLNHYDGILQGHTTDINEYKNWVISRSEKEFETKKSEAFMKKVHGNSFDQSYKPYKHI